MKNIRRKMVVFLLVCSMLISLCACSSGTNAHEGTNSKNQSVSDTVVNNTADLVVDTSAQLGKENNAWDNNQGAVILGTQNKSEYNPGGVLVKVKDSFNDADFGELEYTSADALYAGSKWYLVKLADSEKTEEAVTYLEKLGTFDKVDYDYVMGVTDEVESVDVSGNPDYDKQIYYSLHKVPEGWQQAADNGKKPGGTSDVIIAVIDTGVDYTHLDLRNNIWINTAEIAGNGKDDDGNGYIDDVYGWDCVGNDNDPMDDNGHGTHVAGIIGAENNELGGVGVAYNCKVMVLKAGNSSGYFNNSDIAEAIQYAYMNGASVINMSFGGSSISIAVEEALENAYISCVLVAAAGNDSACNNPSCMMCDRVAVSYPAALPYVIGVMSVSSDGSTVSSFSNYDHNPYNPIEYEVYAVGEEVFSCWPGNKYAILSGTSMAAPTISGIAALYRSYHSDREEYSTKYIQSQIVNTGKLNPYNSLIMRTDVAHSVPDIFAALIQSPKPEVNLYDYFIDDSTSISSVNNGNGVIDAGETVRLYVSLHNRGGVASDVNVSIDTNRGEALSDPYFTFVNTTMELSDIGTYSIWESGDKYFEIIVSADCPNAYIVDFNIRYTYTNGMDVKDTTVYEDDGQQKARFMVSRGFYLPARIEEDTTYTADRLYIVAEDVVIPSNVTVTFEEGCEIQFYDDREYYNSPAVQVYGKLNLNGTMNANIKLFVSNKYEQFVGHIVNEGVLTAQYVDDSNVIIYEPNVANRQATNGWSFIKNSNIRVYNNKCYYLGEVSGFGAYNSFSIATIENCSLLSSANVIALNFNNNYLISSIFTAVAGKNFCNNILLNENNSRSKSTIVLEGNISNNLFYANDFKKMNQIVFEGTPNSLSFLNNALCKIHQQYVSQIFLNYLDSSGGPKIDVYDTLADPAVLWPYIVSIEMFNQDNESITTIGHEAFAVRVTFNRPMDTAKDTYLTFGTTEPYADYRIDGEYVSDTVWEGTYTLKAQIENGRNFLKVNNACAAEDKCKTVFGEYQLHEFTIDTTKAMAMNLQAQALDAGIELTWVQDDYDTLMGYNIYRSESKDGNYIRLNPAILLPSDGRFLDDNAMPGKTYWYTFTVVLSDFSESAPAGRVMAIAKDTMAPSIYHTPVNQGYENNNLVLTCIASDNVAITNVSLYYRVVGSTDWKKLSMVKQNEIYSVTIYGSDVTLAGLEYYIIATDGVNTVTKGSAEVPYTIVVKSTNTLVGLGDVDGNGEVTTKDALMIMQFINGTLILTDDQFKRANLNGDDILSSAEALRILQYINGRVTSLEM